ncbi:hypothetical protein B0H13DRAFT_1886064 [Mycena leptocephala]|nr:hypothetical protein B0H13DRAFT_1886064 [Mycena leptocephala]
MYTYFTTLPNDPWNRKGLVIVAITFTLVGDYANTYLETRKQLKQWCVPSFAFNAYSPNIPDSSIGRSKNIWATLFLYGLILSAVRQFHPDITQLINLRATTQLRTPNQPSDGSNGCRVTHLIMTQVHAAQGGKEELEGDQLIFCTGNAGGKRLEVAAPST